MGGLANLNNSGAWWGILAGLMSTVRTLLCRVWVEARVCIYLVPPAHSKLRICYEDQSNCQLALVSQPRAMANEQ